MALDNAEFISELSITDPPGTDPLNQGDDHIRTTKKAVQQSFPNVGSAVPQSGAQMAQMAIKNEINAFTQPNTFALGQEFTGAITLKQPGTDVTDIHYRNTLGAIRWIVRMQNDADSNDLIFQRRNSSGVIQDVPITVRNATGDIIFGPDSELFGPDGNATVPAFSFVNQSNMGMYRAGSLNLAFSVNGVEQLSIRNDQIRFTQDLVSIQDGTAVSPAYTFVNNGNMGMYRVGVNVLGFATAGVERLQITNGGLRSTLDGGSGLPSYSFASDTTMGMYKVGTNVLGFSTVGIERLRLSSGNMTVGSTQIFVQDGLSTSPSYAFTGHPDTGMFIQAGANLGFSAGSVRRFLVKPNTCNMNLPTTNAGLVSGDCFTSGGFVAIVP